MLSKRTPLKSEGSRRGRQRRAGQTEALRLEEQMKKRKTERKSSSGTHMEDKSPSSHIHTEQQQKQTTPQIIFQNV